MRVAKEKKCTAALEDVIMYSSLFFASLPLLESQQLALFLSLPQFLHLFLILAFILLRASAVPESSAVTSF